MIKDYFAIPWKEMRRRKLRSYLTLLGIIIGVTAVVSLITLGQGLENAIAEQFDTLGTNKLFISPKGNEFSPGLTIDAVTLDKDDLELVRKVQGIRIATGMITTTAKIEFNDQVRYFITYGMSDDIEERKLLGETQSFNVEVGRPLEKGDSHKITLGHDYQLDTLFGKSIEVGDSVLVQDQEYEVIGFLGKIGSPPDDRSVGMLLESYWDVFGGDDEYGILMAEVQPGEDPAIVSERLEKDLRKHRGLAEGKEDFTIQTPEQIAAIFGTVLTIVQIVLIGIAAISLIVGGIGVMNTMYTTILERTKEIGVMKAVGATKKHILSLVIVESGLYGLIGGTIGALIGVALAKLVEAMFIVFLGPAFLSVDINIWLLVGTLLFSFIIGALSGIAPAYRAAKLDVVESLRYE